MHAWVLLHASRLLRGENDDISGKLESILKPDARFCEPSHGPVMFHSGLAVYNGLARAYIWSKPRVLVINKNRWKKDRFSHGFTRYRKKEKKGKERKEIREYLRNIPVYNQLPVDLGVPPHPKLRLQKHLRLILSQLTQFFIVSLH